MIDEIVFIPNHGLVSNEKGVGIPGKDKELVEKLSKKYRMNIATQFITERDSFADGILEKSDRVRLLKIGSRTLKGGKTKKIYCYILSVIHFLTAIISKRKAFWYIYFPGYNSIIAASLCALLRKPYALYVRGEWEYSLFFKAPSRYIFSRAQFILTTGVGFKNMISCVNSNVFPVSPMIAVDNTVVGKRKYSLNDDVTRMLFVGHLSEEKGVYLVLEALHKLVSESPRNFHLDIVGGGSESEVNRLNSEIKKLGVEPFVSYVGHVSSKQELVNRFNAADVFVYPSYFQEGFPRVVYEAMLMGLPIICTILVGMRDFMEDKKNCIEVEPLDVNSLIDAIKQTDNEEYRKNLGLNAKRDVLEYLSQFKGATHAEQVLALIERGG